MWPTSRLRIDPLVRRVYFGGRELLARLRLRHARSLHKFAIWSLLAVYFFVITPVGLARRLLLGRDLRRRSSARSGWHPVRQSSSDPGIYSGTL